MFVVQILARFVEIEADWSVPVRFLFRITEVFKLDIELIAPEVCHARSRPRRVRCERSHT